MKNFQVRHKDIIIPKVIKPRNQPNGKSEPDQEPSETRQYAFTRSVALH
jgi:hypothetical protein